VALVLNGVEAMPANVVGEQQFEAALSPFMGSGGVPFISVGAMHRELHISKDGSNHDFNTGKANEYLEFGDLGEDAMRPDPNRAEAPDKEMSDLEYSLRQTFLVQQHSVRRMAQLKRTFLALSSTTVQGAELGETAQELESLSAHEIKHVLAWKPKAAQDRQDSYPSLRDVEGHLSPERTTAQIEARLGEDDEAKKRKEMKLVVAKGLKDNLPKIRTQIYEEIESLKDLEGNAHELAGITHKITQHVSATQQAQLSELGAAYFINHKVRDAHHKTNAARVGRNQLQKLAGVSKLNGLITSESKFAQNKLQNMLAVVRECSTTLRAKNQDANTSAGLAHNLSVLKKSLNGMLKRQAHVAHQTLKKADGVGAYVNKLRKNLEAHELTPKEAGILP